MKCASKNQGAVTRKKKGFVQDMTTGSVMGHLMYFFLPLLAGHIFQQLYNVVDSVVIGRFEGASTLAAVGMVGSISYLFFSVCDGLAGGIGIQVAQYFGAGNEAGVKKTIANAVYIMGSVSLIMSILGIVLAKPILILLNTPEESFAAAFVYMRIICGATIVVAAYGTISSIMRALGDSRTMLIFLIIASVINIILDVVFVYWLHMGAAGVAWATVIAQFTSGMGALIFGKRMNSYLQLEKKYFILDMAIIKKSFAIGIPLAMQNMMFSISSMAVQFVVNGYGAMVMAAYTTSSKIFNIVRMPIGVWGTGVANFSGQNAGAGRFERIKSCNIKSLILVVIYGACSMVLMFLFGESIVRIFVNEPEVIEIGARGLQITSAFFIISGFTNVFRASLNGIGDSSFTMYNGILEIAVCVILVFSLTKVSFIGMWGVWCTSGLSCMIAGIVCFYRYANGKWKKKIIIEI